MNTVIHTKATYFGFIDKCFVWVSYRDRRCRLEPKPTFTTAKVDGSRDARGIITSPR